MDRVRLGRALGVGARHAARTLVEAVDAATSPDPSPPPHPSSNVTRSVPTPSQPSSRPASQPVTLSGVAEGGRRFTESFGGRFARLGGALWLEFTGVFFGVFALYGISGVWKYRDGLHATTANHDARTHLLLATGMSLVFGYFCISSFVRANHRTQGPAKRR